MTLDDYLRTVASVYESARHAPKDAYTRHCYYQLKRDLWAQFNVLNAFTRVTFTTTDPYGSSREMFESLDRGSLSVYSVADIPSDHPFSERAPNGETFNSVFRAVHDGLAHYPERNSFGKLGEFKAFLAHCRLLGWDSQRALFTETIGQNAWYHFGPKLLDRRAFAEQKVTILPFPLFATHERISLERS